MEQKYRDNIKKQQDILADLSKKGVLLGNLRLALAVLLAGFVTLLIIFWFSIFYLLLIIATLAGFVVLTAFHGRLSGEISYCKGLIQINNQNLMRISGEWKNFADKGSEFLDYNHSFSNDLDIFGDKSLFQFINVTKTPYGRMRLKNDLTNPSYSLADIERRQQAICELGKNDKLCMDFLYASQDIKYDSDLPKVVDYAKNKPEFIKNVSLGYILRFLPYLLLTLCVVFLAIGTTQMRIAASALMIVQVLLWLGFSLKTLGFLSNAEKIHYGLSDYCRLYEVLESCSFEGKLLQQTQQSLSLGEASAAKATKQLGRVLQRIQLRSSGILYILLNILFLWDIGCSLSLSAWAKKYGRFVEGWFCSLGEFESLLSFSLIGGVVSGTCRAKAMHGRHILSVKNIGHPLLCNASRICNSFSLQKNINIISGSNMSGKTTFLRTLGINLLLAKNGCPVCADEMIFSNMKLATSMRISDDLTDGISTFYSELKKIKQILEIAKENDDVFFLIDEIFRGTNSADRTSGAKAVIKKLSALDAYGLLTTHDLALCQSFDEILVKNYSFSESYQNGRLSFDYKIDEGIAKTTNGEYLMKLIGIM